MQHGRTTRRAWVSGLLFTAGLLAGVPSMAGAQDAPILVYCTGVTQSGFIAPAVADSVSDLIKVLKSRKHLRVVDDRREAQVIVTVTGRSVEGTGQRDYTTRSTPTSNGGRRTTSSSRERTVNVVRATMQVGRFKQELVGTGGLWSAAADDVSGQVEKWVKNNAAQIRAQSK